MLCGSLAGFALFGEQKCTNNGGGIIGQMSLSELPWVGLARETTVGPKLY